MKNVALITGASTGIGKAIARIHASHGGDLIVVARRQRLLDDLKAELESEHNIRVLAMALDLTDPGAPQQLYDRAKAENIEVEQLINNAAFGGHGKFHEREWAHSEAMIQLNITALAQLTHLFVQDMVTRNRGKILNVASTAAFLPGPLQGVYYASKAFVLSFSLAIAEELREANISVTTLCPGPVATEFIKTADLEGIETFKHAASAESVAEVGYKAMVQGKLVAINDWRLSFLLNWVVPFLPRRVVLRVSRRTMEKGQNAT